MKNVTAKKGGNAHVVKINKRVVKINDIITVIITVIIRNILWYII